MNIFQKQLVICGKSLAELPDLENKCYVRELVPPVKVSVKEFEAALQQVQQPGFLAQILKWLGSFLQSTGRKDS